MARLVEFAEPLLSALPPGPDARGWVDLPTVAQLVWNGLHRRPLRPGLTSA
jgi:hypothetical protein